MKKLSTSSITNFCWSFYKFGFGNSFIDWIKILLTNQESCVINDGSATSYFKLEKGARQVDLISAYLFIMALEIIFAMIKSNPNIKGLNIFNHNYLYTAYADDTTFFLNDQKSIRELMKTFKLFSKFSGLKRDILKCEVAGIGSQKGVQMAVCGINPIQDGLFWGCSRMGVAKTAPLS